MDVAALKLELGNYTRKNHQEVSAMFYDAPMLDPYMKPITKVKGQYPSIHSITTNVLQRFRPQWDLLGTTKFVPKILKSTRVKVNYKITPAEILSTYLAESLYAENQKKEAMPISRYIMERELKPKIEEDLSWLILNGRDDNNPYGQFEFAFPGLCASIDAAMNDANNPAYLIPVSTITESNAIDQLKAFERAIPLKAARKIKNVFVSTNVMDMYKIDMQATYGGYTNFTEEKFGRTPLGKFKLVQLDWLPDNYMFATLDGNMLKLIDLFNKPEINDIQIQDYDVKIFGEMEIGADFAINQLVFVANFAGNDSGFAAMGSGADDLRKLYFVQ